MRTNDAYAKRVVDDVRDIEPHTIADVDIERVAALVFPCEQTTTHEARNEYDGRQRRDQDAMEREYDDANEKRSSAQQRHPQGQPKETVG